MRKALSSISALVCALTVTAAAAHDGGHDGKPSVTPHSERETAKVLGLEGPSETQGVSSVVVRGAVDLGDEFPPLEGRQFRAREITMEPGGVVAIHRHEQRPGFAYILEGRVIEHRNDHPKPIERTAGDIAVEKTGVAHWWENTSDAPMRALVVDIVATEDE